MAHLSSSRARNGEPQPAPPPPTSSEPATTKRDLTSWWKQFKRGNVKKEEEKEPEPRGIFGVPLITSIPYANVAISLFNETGESYIYGYVPIVVAKCGVFLKEKATDVEGIFRLAGSEKRIKELKVAFDTPPRWGKGLDWTGYTVHDAANILRRYFNQLPEPIIPLQHYDSFREPLRGHQAEAVGHIEGQAPSVGGFDPDASVRVYQHLIKELPALNRQLLLYILDLLAVFAAKSDINKMTTSNLAAIFQPGILSHPQHAMSPQDYRLNQDVLIFLIDNQDHFLIGMEGTAVDEGTVKHIQSGPNTPQGKSPTTPGRKQSGLGRSASAASSIGAESIRKLSGIRRNVSTSSKHSRHSGAIPSPVTPTTSGVHRSNTVPSKKSPAISSTRFSREKHSGSSTPIADDALVPIISAGIPAQAPPRVPEESAQQGLAVEKTNPVAPQSTEQIPAVSHPVPPAIVSPPSEEATSTASDLDNHVTDALALPAKQSLGQGIAGVTPSLEKSEFLEGPVEAPGPVTSDELTPAVRTFTQILAKVSPSNDEKGRKPNKLQKKQRVPSSTNPSAHSSTHSLSGPNTVTEPLPVHAPFGSILGGHPVNTSKEGLPGFTHDVSSSRHSGATLKPTRSPSPSFRSHSTATEYSETEGVDDGQVGKEEKKERSFWKSHRRAESKATPTASQTELGQMAGADKSMSSFGSGSGWGRRSLQLDSQAGSDSSGFGLGNDAKEHEKRNPFSWFNEKRRERKEREAEKLRAKSPPPSSVDVSRLAQPTDGMVMRGRSMDIPRTANSQGSSDITPTGMPGQAALPNSDVSRAPA
ncbi:RhoGAP-domain-containing protein [Delitschia confertaspora ATCC 74209]|uniref:RhoGAP-domain-containing protein n=1 Tax=Delitschia confertaspora ATCC 74209 TaxID=1513339 RepID=A0A9P4JHH6_9PLEO|nr:RhoGAP-domain-containing protein [Delitschia confertaspora ATCC 74209]